MAAGHQARVLTQEELAVLQSDTECVSDFKRNKLEAEARKNWDLFYKRNSTNFFKDRHWLTREFPELVQAITEVSSVYLYTCTCVNGRLCSCPLECGDPFSWKRDVEWATHCFLY